MTVRRAAPPLLVALLVLTSAGQASVSPDAQVKLAGGRVSIQATATPLSVILDRLSRNTGMKVVYEGAPPSDRLTAAIEAASETEAVSRLLEGLGLTYALKLDATGRHVETLYITGAASSARRASSTPTAPPPSFAEQEADEDSMAMGQETDVDPATGQAPGVAMEGPAPGTPGYQGGVAMPGGAPTGTDQAPAFPSGASFPTPNNPAYPFPSPPVVPGPASYPAPNVSS